MSSTPSRCASMKAAAIAVLLEALAITIGPRVDQALVGELVVDQERGEEERPQQHLDLLGVRRGRRDRSAVAR